MSAEDHARLCAGTGGIVVDSIDSAHVTIRCGTCGRLVVTYLDPARPEQGAGVADTPREQIAA